MEGRYSDDNPTLHFSQSPDPDRVSLRKDTAAEQLFTNLPVKLQPRFQPRWPSPPALASTLLAVTDAMPYFSC